MKANGNNSQNITLRKKRLSDAGNDYSWYTDRELSSLDATTPLTMIFEDYLEDYASELYYPYPGRHAFAIETQDVKHIGNCVYYNLDSEKRETELGIMIGNRDYWNRGFGTSAVNALVSHIFNRTNLNRIYLKTLTNNYRAQECFKKCNFTQCGYMDKNGYKFLLMELYRDKWLELQTEVNTEPTQI